jgi:GNAT superfamily N-acetyltransferase
MDSGAPLSLVLAANPEHWAEFHRIRRTVLWEARGRYDYDDAHPDDYLPSNLPLLLLSGDEVVATVRLDLLDDTYTAAFRRLAVAGDKQRQGFGRALIERAEIMAVQIGRTKFIPRVARDAVTFWQRLGYNLQNEVGRDLYENPLMMKERDG